MQYNPSNQGYANQQHPYVNQYPPLNQPQAGSNYGHSPSNAPPPYSQYPQQPGSYLAPGSVYYGQGAGPQQGVILTPVHPTWNTMSSTQVTSSLRAFLTISGILLIVWGVLTLGLEIGVVVYARRSYYFGFVAGGYLIGTGITLLITSCRGSYVLRNLMTTLGICIFFCLLAVILSIVSMALHIGCYNIYFDVWRCNTKIMNDLKLAVLIFYIVAFIHTIINIVVIGRAQAASVSSHNPHVLTPK